MSSLSGAAPKLTIKAANQKYNDFVIDNFDVDWSVMRLKQYLHLNYPNNPVREINFMWNVLSLVGDLYDIIICVVF